MPGPDPDFAPLRQIGWPFDGPPLDPQWAACWAAHPGARPARVVEQHRSGYRLAEGPDRVYAAESPPEWLRRAAAAESDQRAAVGDWVLQRDGRILALLPRRSCIKRGAAGEHYRQQVIAANIDTAFVLCGLDDDFNPRRIERYLLLAGNGGTAPVVVLTKADLDAHTPTDGRSRVDQARAALAGLEARGIPVLAIDARDPDSTQALQPWLGAGRTVVLVGSSGAGKSTLTNTLLGQARMRTGQVRGSDSRGRHTTTYRALMTLPDGACLIDTPGMRELKPTGEERLDVGGFADVEALAAQCRFRDCVHQGEPGCAVRAAVNDGRLDPERLAHYQKLRAELADAADQLAARLSKKGAAKVQARALHKRVDEKYGRH